MSDQQPQGPGQTPPQPAPYQGAPAAQPAAPAPGAHPAYPAQPAPQGYPAPQPGYAQPAQPTYPAQPGYQPQPVQPTYAPPAQPGYAQPGYPAPAYGAGYSAYPAVPRGASSPDDLTLPLYGATFGQALKRFFKSYATFSGRASRSEYWWVQLFITLVSFVAMVLVIATGAISAGMAAETGEPGWAIGVLIFVGILMTVFALGIIVPSLAISWRRLHDANFAGPFWFLSLTSVGSVVVLVFTILPSNPEGQRFDRV